MSKIPELKMFADPEGHDGGDVVVSHPASTSRCVSNVGSSGLLEPNSAKAGSAKATIVVETAINVIKHLRMIPPDPSEQHSKGASSRLSRLASSDSRSFLINVKRASVRVRVF